LAPSFFSLLSDLSATVASSHNLITGFATPLLVSTAILPLIPTSLEALITPAISDELNRPLTAAESENYSNSTFIGDNGILALHLDMQAALQQSLLSAFLLFGMPGDDCHRACLQDEKWESEISHIMLYL
jgi:hypothetical protein